MHRMLRITLGMAMLALTAGSVTAATIYEAELTPEQVVPGSGAEAYGQATLIVSDDESSLFLTVNFAGLESTQTGAMLLRAATDAAGTVLEALPLGTPLAVTTAFTPTAAEALDAGELAVQIASENWPEGAIRGDFVFVTVGVDETSWTRVKQLFDR
jgi:hypothetical protein